MKCPECHGRLEREDQRGVPAFRCERDEGRCLTLGGLRKLVAREHVLELWREVREVGTESRRSCPDCAQRMVLVTAQSADAEFELDACTVCQLIWFDAGELRAFAPHGEEPADPNAARNDLSERARTQLALAEIETRDLAREAEEDVEAARIILTSMANRPIATFRTTRVLESLGVLFFDLLFILV